MNNIETNAIINEGIILKLKRSKAIVLTNKLDFVKLKRTPDMTRGQKVFFDGSDLFLSESIFNKKVAMRSVSALASVAAVFFIIFYGFGFFNTNFNANRDYTYLSIDINPSLELVLDRKNVVLEATPLNSDAKILLNNITIDNLSIDVALSEILDSSRKEGFISNENNTILFSASPLFENEDELKEDDMKEKDEEITNILNSLKKLADDDGLSSEIIKANPKNRKTALNYGVSMGKYALYTRANEKGMNITIDEVRSTSVSNILVKIKSADPDFFTGEEPIFASVSPSNTPVLANTATPVKITPLPEQTSDVVPTPDVITPVPTTGHFASITNNPVTSVVQNETPRSNVSPAPSATLFRYTLKPDSTPAPTNITAPTNTP